MLVFCVVVYPIIHFTVFITRLYMAVVAGSLAFLILLRRAFYNADQSIKRKNKESDS